MFRFTSFVLAALSLGVVGAGGCQSNHSEGYMHKPSPDAMAGTPTDQGVACDKCETVWVHNPEVNQKGHVVGYSDKKQMTCPDCRSMAENFFTTGKMEHTCNACGGNMSGCAMH